MFLDIYNSSLGGTWGFVPLSSGEVRHMAESLRHLIVPELALVAEVNGKPIGTVFCLLDYNPRIKAINGRRARPLETQRTRRRRGGRAGRGRTRLCAPRWCA